MAFSLEHIYISRRHSLTRCCETGGTTEKRSCPKPKPTPSSTICLLALRWLIFIIRMYFFPILVSIVPRSGLLIERIGPNISFLDNDPHEVHRRSKWPLHVGLRLLCPCPLSYTVPSGSHFKRSWEFVSNLDYEWSFIRGHRPYRWTIWVCSPTLFSAFCLHSLKPQPDPLLV